MFFHSILRIRRAESQGETITLQPRVFFISGQKMKYILPLSPVPNSKRRNRLRRLRYNYLLVEQRGLFSRY